MDRVATHRDPLLLKIIRNISAWTFKEQEVRCAVLCCAVLCCAVLYCTVLYCTVLYCAVLCCTLLYSTVLYSTLLYSTLLYSTLPYSNLMHFIPNRFIRFLYLIISTDNSTSFLFSCFPFLYFLNPYLTLSPSISMLPLF